MKNGQLDCTHSFYLKMYHIFLANGTVHHNNFDLLMVDEAGDINPVTLEIFKLIKATKKLMVGDPNQNIYSFNHTINAFIEMADTGILLELTTSFRVADYIAADIQRFSRVFFNSTMVFHGIPYTDKTIKTRAFIARTNSSLIGKIIQLNRTNSKYSLIRKASLIFELPLLIMGLKPHGKVYNKAYSFLQDDTNKYFSNNKLMDDYTSLQAYLNSLYSDDVAISSALGVLRKFTPKEIIAASKSAISHENQVSDLTLCTSHSSKGLEWDSVEIAEDTNTKIGKIFTKKILSGKQLDNDELEECRLAYVAFTRAKIELLNADCLYLSKYAL